MSSQTLWIFTCVTATYISHLIQQPYAPSSQFSDTLLSGFILLETRDL